MTKEVRDRLDRQLAEVELLIEDIDAISARLCEAADAAVKNMSKNSIVDKKQAGA